MNDKSAGFNIKAVIQETGLNADTLRAWERRYGLPAPKRTSGGHRIYSLRDIQILNWLKARQKEGMSISRAVDRWRNLELNGQDPLTSYSPQRQQLESGGDLLADLCQAWVKACLDFNEQAAEQKTAEAFAIYNPEIVCSSLLQKGLSIIGNQWYEGKASVQHEHFASALAMRRLHALMVAAPAPIRPGRILAACPEGEEHEFGLLLLAVLLRRQSWDVLYLGANVPIVQLESALQAADPFLVVSIAQTLPAAASLRRMGELLSTRGVQLAYGGGIINTLPSIQNMIPGYHLGGDIAEAVQMVGKLWYLKPPIQHAQPVPPEQQQALQRYLEFHQHINLLVSQTIGRAEISPAYLEIALTALHQHLAAALTLGDIRLVEHSLRWLEGLLQHAGLPKGLLTHFLDVYQAAFETYLPEDNQVVFSGMFKEFLEK